MRKRSILPTLAVCLVAVGIGFQNCGKGFRAQTSLDLGSQSLAISFSLSDLTSGSPEYSKGQTVNLFSRGDELVTAWCMTEDSAWTPQKPCPSGTTPDGWLTKKPGSFQLSSGDGQKSVYFWVKDKEGKTTKAIGNVFLDQTKPAVTVTTPPALHSKSNASNINFGIIETGSGKASGQCQLDAQGPTPCESMVNLTNLSEGFHSLKIQVRDKAGNVGETILNWQNDYTNPQVTISSSPANPTSATSATFGFNAFDSGSGIGTPECRIDGNAFAACSSPVNFPILTPGSHTFSVRTIDRAQNTSQTSTYTWEVVPSTLSVGITASPTDPTNNTSGNFSFTANGTAAITLRCALDNGESSLCSSPKSYPGLSQGPHTF